MCLCNSKDDYGAFAENTSEAGGRLMKGVNLMVRDLQGLVRTSAFILSEIHSHQRLE